MRPSRTASSQWLKRAFNVERHVGSTDIPTFLCPAITRSTTSATSPRIPSLHTQRIRTQGRRSYTTSTTSPTIKTTSPSVPDPALLRHADTKSLPVACSGCGALSQVSDPEQAGYFNLERKAVQSYLGLYKEEKHARKDDVIVQDILKNLDLGKLGDVGEMLKSVAGADRPPPAPETPAPETAKPPLCERCHKLVHHHSGVPIYHPTIDSIRETIEDSPYKYNHVYHVVDAADFPMSLIPRINDLLDLLPLRSTNRRSKTAEFIRGQKTEVSFIITRSDLLAPKKEHVDHLMPYLTETLRSALGRKGRGVRLGNVWCVSAKRNWWTKDLKEEVWKNRGASWMVGKVNVGKSQLFEAIFPKGRMDWKQKPRKEIGIDVFASEKEAKFKRPNAADPLAVAEDSLLPPPQEETQFPPMPVVSPLPGTTASPIRVPFGNGRGELIDLPGLNRSDLEAHVKEEHRSSLVMKHRIVPEQQVIKPGQSLLIGGFIRITPATPGLIFLAYSFTPLNAHMTSTEKAIAVQEQTEEAPNVENIALPGTGELIKKAGTFELRHDVTKIRAGPITRREAVGISVDRLPYRVVGIDILIEGCGWVEIVAQVRTKDLLRQAAPPPKPKKVEQDEKNKSGILQSLDLLSDAEKLAGKLQEAGKQEAESQDAEKQEADAPKPRQGTAGTPDRLTSLDLLSDDTVAEKAQEEAEEPAGPAWPVVEVFSPNGKFIASRPPLNGWMLNKPKKTSTKSRPRPSMKGAKKMVKHGRRQTGGFRDQSGE
ncbi:hypothetical protein GE09DRAFT_1150611 [Coniochaeta sp. 2T2.1]|nr:hypothetical protein GE09DRAFT_1150611 [Coniochaeta sp. 2T2.1]